MARRKNPDITYFYSEKFKHFLDSTVDYTNCVFIDELINLEHTDIESDGFQGSFIDFGSKEDMISFTSKTKIYKMYKEEDTETDFDTWLEEKEKSTEFWTLNRTEIRAGRFIHKMLGETDLEEIEEFSNMYKSYNSSFKYEMQVVHGDDIQKYYNTYNQEIENRHGRLAGSCMRYDDKEEIIAKKNGWESTKDRLQFYSKNPNVGLLILKYKDSLKIKGRALIWSLKDGKKYIDIAYLDYEHDIFLYQKYAKDNNHLIYDEKLFDEEQLPYMEVESNVIIKELFGDTRNRSSKLCEPHLDTFCYNTRTNKIST